MSTTTWSVLYTYGSVNCNASSLLSVTANAMGPCYLLSSTSSFTMSCSSSSSSSSTVSMTCTAFASPDCSGPATQGAFACPYNFDYPSGCSGGIKATCESDDPSPSWLSYPGYVLYSNSSASASQCSTNAPVTLYGFNPGCAELEIGGLLHYSREAVIANNDLVLRSYTKTHCAGNYTSQIVVSGLDSCHKKSASTTLTSLRSGSRFLQASGENVYGASSLALIPSVESATGNGGGSSSNNSSSGSGLALTTSAIAALSCVGFLLILLFAYTVRRHYRLKKGKADEVTINQALLDGPDSQQQ